MNEESDDIELQGSIEKIRPSTKEEKEELNKLPKMDFRINRTTEYPIVESVPIHFDDPIPTSLYIEYTRPEGHKGNIFHHPV